MPRELADLGLKTTGDEMDTIARYVEHPYFLRSLTQSEAYPGPKTRDKHKVVQQQQPQQKQVITVQKPELLQVQGVDSRQAYDIPSPQLPPPPRPKGTSANDLYESLDARDQEIRKGRTTLNDATPMSNQLSLILLIFSCCMFSYGEADFSDQCKDYCWYMSRHVPREGEVSTSGHPQTQLV